MRRLGYLEGDKGRDESFTVPVDTSDHSKNEKALQSLHLSAATHTRHEMNKPLYVFRKKRSNGDRNSMKTIFHPLRLVIGDSNTSLRRLIRVPLSSADIKALYQFVLL